MEIADILEPQSVFPKVKVASKRALLEFLAQKAGSLVKLKSELILETVMERERLNTTGVGQGVAIPHGRIKGLDRRFGLFAQLDEPVDYESIDGLPVDLVFLLLVPEAAGADHLKALARASRLFRNPTVCEKLRASNDGAPLFAILTEPAANAQAA